MIVTLYDAATGDVLSHVTGMSQESRDNILADHPEFGIWEGEHVDGSLYRIDVNADPKVIVARADVPTPEEVAAQELAEERSRMQVYRLSFLRAFRLVSYGGGTLADTLDLVLAAATAEEAEDFANVTQFERWRPEIPAYLQNPAGIDLTEAQIDDLFRLAMHLEESGPGSQASWDGGTGSLTLV